MADRHLIYVADDDAAVRHFLSYRLESEGFAVETFADGSALAAGFGGRRPECVVADLRMPHMSGLELLHWVEAQEERVPVIIMTGHGDVPATVAAFRSGVFDFLEKPFDELYLVERIRKALTVAEERRQRQQLRREAAARYRRLSRRERDVVALVVKGLTNKEIAVRLDLGLRTVESHRFQIMKKFETASVCDVTRAMAVLGA